MKKTFGGEAKQNPPDSTYSPMYINLFDIFQQKLNNLIKKSPLVIVDTKSDI